jgi:anti-sigma B factor antagonist
MGHDAAMLVAEVGDARDGYVTIHVRGEFDLAGVEAFTDAIDAATGGGPVVVELDLSDVSFIDSSGVGAIVVAARTVATRGSAVRIGGRSPVVERVLEVSGLEAALETPADD